MFDHRIIPPLLLEPRTGLFPVESVLYTVEVKSRLTKGELARAHTGARVVGDLEYQPGRYYDGIGAEPTNVRDAPIVSALIAFSSDLSGDPNNEIERYDDVRGRDLPYLSAICIVGRGYWYWKKDCWEFQAPSKDCEEMLQLVAGMMNTYPWIAAKRGHPRLGRYLI